MAAAEHKALVRRYFDEQWRRTMKLSSTRVITEDYATLLRFYRDVVGLKLEFEDAERGFAYFDAEGVGVEVMLRETMAGLLGTSSQGSLQARTQGVLDFRVTDVDATYAALVAAGATPLDEPHDHPSWGVRGAHVGDPDGNIILILCPLS
jgi:lactoylglutathione lyase